MRFSACCSGSVRADGVAYDHDLAAGEAANAPGAAEECGMTGTAAAQDHGAASD